METFAIVGYNPAKEYLEDTNREIYCQGILLECKDGYEAFDQGRKMITEASKFVVLNMEDLEDYINKAETYAGDGEIKAFTEDYLGCEDAGWSVCIELYHLKEQLA